jgi:hypothetical protein
VHPDLCVRARFNLLFALVALVALVALFALFATGPVQAATLHYEAFIAGARAGEATVIVAVVENRYEVTGTARAEGVVEVFSDWRTRFQAHGQLIGTTPQPAEYSYVERDDDQLREITVSDGMLRYFKNGRKRRERASPAGLDVLTALFVQPSCQNQQSVHTGRKFFRLTRMASEPQGVCRYLVVDDDEDRYRADIRFGQREQLTVPISITVRGFLTGRVVLVDQ